LSWQISAGLGVVLALTLGGFKLYYDKAEAEKENLLVQIKQAQANTQLLENTVAKQNQEFLNQQKKTQEVMQRVTELSEEHAKAVEEVNEIRKKFAKHNLDVLSLRKPKLIEKIINKGTANVLQNLETITDPASP
jgi:multidrug resistance efflux pump|tara:strand:+ start:144 stop:548 length:405 start_codon:yes stop_codon:yes gene_type:complete